MVKNIITEISEEDFRKLDLKVYRHERIKVDEKTHRFEMVERSLNEILDKEIESCIESGYESDYLDLQLPVTIAIHEPPTEKDHKSVAKMFPRMSEKEIHEYCLRACSYLDKFMNQYTGAQTYQLGWGIKHLYSTRDYFEAHEDYWRVAKKETKVIYRVKLSESWLDKFVFKHKSVKEDWPYNELPDGVSPDYIVAFLVINFDLAEDGAYKEVGRYGRFIYKHSEHHVPVDKNGKAIERDM